jgi:hypothetical protein
MHEISVVSGGDQRRGALVGVHISVEELIKKLVVR